MQIPNNSILSLSGVQSGGVQRRQSRMQRAREVPARTGTATSICLQRQLRRHERPLREKKDGEPPFFFRRQCLVVTSPATCELPTLSFGYGVRECGQRAGNHGRYSVVLLFGERSKSKGQGKERKRKQRTQTRDRGGGQAQGPHLHERAGFWKDDQGDRWALLLLTRDTDNENRKNFLTVFSQDRRAGTCSFLPIS